MEDGIPDDNALLKMIDKVDVNRASDNLDKKNTKLMERRMRDYIEKDKARTRRHREKVFFYLFIKKKEMTTIWGKVKDFFGYGDDDHMDTSIIDSSSNNNTNRYSRKCAIKYKAVVRKTKGFCYSKR